MADNNDPDPIRRRSVLKSAASAGLGALALGGVASAHDDTGSDELRVVHTRELSGERERRNVATLRESRPVLDLEAEIQSHTGLQRREGTAIAVTTNDQTVNEADPVVVVQGYSAERDEDSAGLLFTIVADLEEGETRRGPVAAFGLSAERFSDGPSTTHDGGTTYSVTGYSYDSSGAAQVARESTVSVTNDLSTEGFHDALGCGACVAIVNTLCDGGTGSVSRYACLQACAPFLGSVWGYGACGAACFVIVDTINNYGCAVAAATICAAVGVCD